MVLPVGIHAAHRACQVRRTSSAIRGQRPAPPAVHAVAAGIACSGPHLALEASARRHPRHPEPPGHWPTLPFTPPPGAPADAGPVRRGQSATIGIPHACEMAHGRCFPLAQDCPAGGRLRGGLPTAAIQTA
jgi:hypothetical protein